MSNPETVLSAQIQLAIGSEPDLLLLRNSVGFDERARATYGLGVGSPDLVGILAPRGRLVAFEVKTRTGRLAPEQRRVHVAWERHGALVAVVRSVSEARLALATFREVSK